LAEGLEGFAGEDSFDGEMEEVAEIEREGKGGVVVAAFEEADGLVVDAEGIGQVLAGEVAFCPKNAESVIQNVALHCTMLLYATKMSRVWMEKV